MNILEMIKIGSNFLRENKIRSHILDSEILLSNVLNKSREKILVNSNQKLNSRNILKFKKYMDNPESFAKLYNSEKGSLIDPLRGAFSESFLYKMVSLDGAYGGISIGKGEFFLCLMCGDISFEGESEGDLDWAGKGLEIKNKGAKPTGQKASYGPNSHQLIFKNLFKYFKQLC